MTEGSGVSTVTDAFGANLLVLGILFGERRVLAYLHVSGDHGTQLETQLLWLRTLPLLLSH